MVGRGGLTFRKVVVVGSSLELHSTWDKEQLQHGEAPEGVRGACPRC